ncbi:MAG TPA: 1-acyl-sn-glycerol-3-phosphate acyltransferase [Gammaproteobacteria bacterium]|nr:1-acyl-sn-glycerol-3-phosphate acyltransferase [Gammaproteobacteria bacterium]
MLSRINHIWRILATGACFAVFSLGGLLLSITVFPLIRLMVREPEQQHDTTQSVIHFSFRLFVWFMRTCKVLQLTVIGSEKLKSAGDCLIIANHPCLIDVVLIISLLKKTGCIVKQSMWSNRFLRGVVASAGYIKNSADPECLISDCTQYVEGGSPLIIFPEGTRTTPGAQLKFHRGAANIALRSKKAITPVIISCIPPTLLKNQKWYHVPSSGPMKIILRVGDPINVHPFIDENMPAASRKLTRFLENYYQREILNNEQISTGNQSIDYRMSGS